MTRFLKDSLSAIIICAALFTSCSTQQKVIRESNPNRKFTVENNIPIHVRAVAEYVTPASYGARRLLTGGQYFVEVLNDMAYVDLPYVGRIDMPRGFLLDGSCFKEPYRELDVERNQKDDGSIMKFKAEHEGIVYTITLNLWDGGRCEITLHPHDGQPCFFDGTWDESQLYDREGNPLPVLYY